MRKPGIVLGAAGSIWFGIVLAGSSWAAEPTVAVCAIQQAASCGVEEVCERVLPAGVNLPPLMKFDTRAGMVESRLQNGSMRTSKIATSSTEKGALVLQGVDEGHPWAMRVDSENGEFTMSVLRERATIVGFGVCSAKILE